MKNLVFLTYLAFCLASCGDKTKTVEQKVVVPPVSTINQDSIDIAGTLHSFFKWYDATGEHLIEKIDFVDEKGKHPKLDEVALDKYYAEFLKSGTVSAEFVTNETNYYRECAKTWKEEESGEVISCMDYDRYYCGQDFEPKEFLTAGVTSKITGDHAIVQLMLDPKGQNGSPRDFEMKKENGKWLLSKIGCE